MTVVDVTYGNITQEEGDRLFWATADDSHSGLAGNTEPWITGLVVALLKASGQRTALETGAFMGSTTRALALALRDLGGGTLTACEMDPVRADGVDALLRESEAAEFPESTVQWSVRCMDALDVIRSLPDRSLGFAFVDDDHTKTHVAAEIEALLPKMIPNGLIVCHDVYGVCDLQEIVAAYGGYSLDLPRAGPAGGLGVIQCR